MKLAIWWIRRDLRLTDNQALQAAIDANSTDTSSAILPLFIVDPTLLHSPWVGEKRLAFLFAGLHALDQQLRDKGSFLTIRHGAPNRVFHELRHDLANAEIELAGIYAEADHSPYATKRDQQISSEHPLSLHEGLTVHPIGSAYKDDGSPYVVFTPYSRRWRQQPSIERQQIISAPKTITTPQVIATDPLPDIPALAATLPFSAGEKAAKQRLHVFLQGHDAPIFSYANQRDRPFADATSHLSPYLRFGMISPRLAALGAHSAREKATTKIARDGADTWLTELIWRDFYLTILAAFPRVRKNAFRAEYNQIAWDNNETLFAAWCAGQSGYPFIDAAMRQLRTIGWMHNRARMVVASFLVKDLLIDWRWGEQWFMQQLVDGDPAANNGGWQWTAGTGTDAAPYFRIFNPISQSEKFDPTGEYIRQWVPELQSVPAKQIHTPWKMSKAEQTDAACIIGENYPEPIIAHKWARERALAAYQAIKQS